MSDQTIWLTPAAHDGLQQELEELTTTGSREISERIADVLELAGLTPLFQIYDSESEAIESFA